MSVFVPSLRRAEQSPAEKAGPLGPGASRLMTEYPLASILGRDPRKKMRKAWELGISVPWIRAAERVITGKGSTVEWHLEDIEDNEIDDTTTDQDALRVQRLLEQPQANLTVGRRLTGREMKDLTLRHMGLCGTAFWFLDETDGLGIPANLLYIRPDRMWPDDDAQGNLVDWILDPTPNGGGTRLGLKNVLQFNLQPPDEGHYGTGLVESALMKAALTVSTDSHAAAVLSAGGRIQGIVSPKTGDIPQTIYDQMVLDARTITEQPDAAKRMQIIRAPVDFTSTAMTMADARILEMMERTRDDLLALWGVPPTQLGVAGPAGLNSGDARAYDEAALWQNAIHPRLISFREVIQFQFLDSMRPGLVLEYEIDEPSFDDDAPKYDTLTKSIAVALRNRERRELIGLDPFGPGVLGISGTPVDDEVWLPATSVLAFAAPSEMVAPTPQAVTPAPAPEPTKQAAMAGETAALTGPPEVGKASIPRTGRGIHQAMVRLRASIDRTMTPKMRNAVRSFLDEQRNVVKARIREYAEHIRTHPKDSTIWWDAKRWDRDLAKALRPSMVGVTETVSSTVAEMLPPQKAGPTDVVDRALERGAARVTRINETTRDALVSLIATGIESEEGLGSFIDTIDLMPAFDEYRAEMVARTELMFAYNSAAIDSYREGGVSQVQAIDGDDDPECAERNGETFDVDEADSIDDHPNGTLDWVPIIEDLTGEGE